MPCSFQRSLRRHIVRAMTCCLSAAFLAAALANAQSAPPADFASGLSWRLVGPFRGGRVTAVSGIAGDPKTYYMGTPGGGVWKTVDAGVTWLPIFDSAHVASIGDLVVAPSDPNIIYVATGEQSPGNGVWKSTDAGATWTNIGIRDSKIIPSLLVDPRDANLVYVAAFGESTPNDARGIYKSSDGGNSWRKVFYKDDHTSPAELCFDPSDTHILYASVRQVIPLEPGQKPPEGLDTVIMKSTDSGETWNLLSDKGLPADHRGRVGLAVAFGLSGKRLFALMNQGLFRSDDGGENWRKITTDTRVLGSSYFGRVYSDPHNVDVVYVMQTSTYRSTDGGQTFSAWKGTPSGEDDHVLWFAPEDPKRIFMGTDQGAVVTLDDGKIWSTWYNQPTGQFYRVSTDRVFPYRLYAAQQDSGSVSVVSRSDFGFITYRDWFPTGAFESGFIAPDPRDANFVYSIGWYGTVIRLDRNTGQIATTFVPPANYRTVWETPLLFPPRDPHSLLYASQYVLRSSDNGLTWKEISGDLTAKAPETPATPKLSAGGGHVPTKEDAESSDDDDDPLMQQPGHGAIQALAPSPLDPNTIWVGSTTGLIHVTHDGATWSDVTPTGLPQHAYINSIEASPHDANTAFAAIFARRDFHPYFYRTRDTGKTWEKITTGLPDMGIARVVREDPGRKGLLFAGTETAVYFSYDSGDHWQPLQFNLPAASVRDLTITGADLVLATFGRGLWILDNISPLRQWTPDLSASAARVFLPETATRVHWDNYPDTPLQPGTPASLNPPDGAIVDYYLKASPKGEMTLDVLDDGGKLVRRYSSNPSDETIAPPNVPEFWFSPTPRLSNTPGLHRFVWDLRYPHPTALPYGYFGERLKYTEYTLPDHAVPGETPRFQPPGPFVAPGTYSLVLTVDGKKYQQKLQVVPDPRVHIDSASYVAQLELSRKICDLMESDARAFNSVVALHKEFDARKTELPTTPPKELLDALTALEKQLTTLEDGANDAPGFGPINRDLGRDLVMVQSADMRPAESARNAVIASCNLYLKNVAASEKLNSDGLASLNALLAAQKLPPLKYAPPQNSTVSCSP
ncbi:MAG TPA: hypothetical protein VGF19_01120 [Candidatus Acidoferrum sp.]